MSSECIIILVSLLVWCTSQYLVIESIDSEPHSDLYHHSRPSAILVLEFVMINNRLIVSTAYQFSGTQNVIPFIYEMNHLKIEETLHETNCFLRIPFSKCLILSRYKSLNLLGVMHLNLLILHNFTHVSKGFEFLFWCSFK